MNGQELLDWQYYTETFLYIRTKEKAVVPFILNPVQRLYAKQATRRDVILKGRQHGISTATLARFYHDTITNEGTNTKIITQKREAAEELLETVKLFYERTPPQFRPRVEYDSKYQFSFPDLHSQITIGSGVEGVGRSETIHNLHVTEIPWWKADPEDVMPGLLEAVPEGAGNVVIESTPGPVGDWFYQLVQQARRGESRFRLHELPWWLNPEYRMVLEPGEKLEPDQEEAALVQAHGLTPEQIKWRRAKILDIGRRKFLQEYELDFASSGYAIFDADVIKRWMLTVREPLPGWPEGWRIFEPPQKGVKYVIGADVAEGLATGDYDAAQIVRRDTARVVGVLHGHWAPEVFAAKLSQAGLKYNYALLAPERNNHGHVVILKLREWRYPQLAWWNKKPGWETTPETKPVIIDGLAEAIRREWIEPLPDMGTLQELSAFLDLGRGKMGAAPGAHDDLVMALAIALFVRKVALRVGSGEGNSDVAASVID